MNPKLIEKLKESLAAVVPITLIVMGISVLLVPLELGTVVMFFVGALMLIVGMGFFQLGAEISMTPMGKGIGSELAGSRRLPVILGVGFLMGAIITMAEPDLQVLANQVPAIPNRVLVLTVAVGVGVFLALAILRILLKIRLSVLLMCLYLGLIVLSFFVPADFLAVAFDSGGVTTGPITVPFIMAMGVGLASVRGDKSAGDDSFGLVALSSVGPVLAVLVLGCFYDPGQASYSLSDVAEVATTRDVARVFALEVPGYAAEVLTSFLPIAGVFVVFQLISRRYRARQIRQILVGFLYTYVGLVLFLCGVNVGFSPVGAALGVALAARSAGHADRLLYRQGGARHSGAEPSGAGCDQRLHFRRGDESVPVRRRGGQRGAGHAASAHRSARPVDPDPGLPHRAGALAAGAAAVRGHCL